MRLALKHSLCHTKSTRARLDTDTPASAKRTRLTADGIITSMDPTDLALKYLLRHTKATLDKLAIVVKSRWAAAKVVGQRQKSLGSGKSRWAAVQCRTPQSGRVRMLRRMYR